MDRVLVGDDDDISVRVVDIEASGHRGHSLCDLLERLTRKRQRGRTLQIGLQLTWKRLRNRSPGVASPSTHYLPLGEVRVDLDGYSGPGGDFFCRAQAAFERRRPDRDHRTGSEVSPGTSCLFDPLRRQPEAREVGIDEVVGVVDLCVTDQMNQSSHALSLAGCSSNMG